MPNQPKTPMLSVRCDRELRDAARRKAQAEGSTLTDVIVSHLRRYVAAPEPGRWQGRPMRKTVRTTEAPHEFKPSKANPLKCETCGTAKGRHP